ncbi:MAG: extracellular solute-binding protein [Planctomycetota bacterium]
MTSDRFGVAVVLGLLGVLVGVPFLLSAGRGDAPEADARRLIVVTPHTQQIRTEFGRAFASWHEREFGESVAIDYRTPGGTSEIRRQLQAQFRAAAVGGQVSLAGEGGGTAVVEPGVIGFDLMFGGGSYDHGTLKSGVRVKVDGQDVDVPMSTPADFTQAELDAIFGPNAVGTELLYDPEQYWIGTALSSFGIIFNRPLLARLGLDEPDAWQDLTDPRLLGWIALADPRSSGSITTTFDSILGNLGWDEGWRVLRAMCGNSRSITNSSTKPPLDVGAGEAAMGLAIDFYGRGQAQVLAEAGDDRLGYAEPTGAVYIDADPVSVIRGGPDPELANRFVRFMLTEEAQALWQFPALRRDDAADNPLGPDGERMGPDANELRRMPVRRVMYERYFEHFKDQVQPFEIASKVSNPGWRTGVQMMMGGFGIDSADECRKAWGVIASAERTPGFPPDVLAEMRRTFYSFPDTPVTLVQSHPRFGVLSDQAKAALPADRMLRLDTLRVLLETDEIAASATALAELRSLADAPPVALPFLQDTYRAIRNEWRNPTVEARLKIEYTRYFRDAYARIIEMYEQNRTAIAAAEEN